MTETMTYTRTLEVTTCWCGIVYAVPKTLLKHAHNDGTEIHCPLGHTVVWRETEAMRLKKKLEAEQAWAASLTHSLDQERASHSATKGQLTKTRKRVTNGVCPCCKRTFANVARHMKTKHPAEVTQANE